MTRTLLAIAALGAIVCVISFSILHMIGGETFVFDHGRRHRHFETVADVGDGPPTTRDLPWLGADNLHIGYPAEITYTQGPITKVSVTGPKAIIDEMSMDGGHLVTPDRPWGFMHHDPHVTIAVSSPNTHVFHLSGAEDLTINGYDQDALDLYISGAGNVRATGKAKHLTAHLSGAGSLNLAALPIDDASVHMSGAGSATIDPKQSADVSISGAGDVKLLTRPPTLHSKISGFGNISAP